LKIENEKLEAGDRKPEAGVNAKYVTSLRGLACCEARSKRNPENN